MKEVTVGVVAFDRTGKIIVIKRKNPPAAGLWTLPMGHVNLGENLESAAIREVQEETGVHVKIERELGAFHYRDLTLTIFLGKVTGGNLRAGDDALEVKLEDIGNLSRSNHQNQVGSSDAWAYEMHEDIIKLLYDSFISPYGVQEERENPESEE